ncbi:MDR family MFS transporter [Acetilactobacillus jinshanensis]|uniref:DHA2 family efflux MFS transporter permease subunit n=1 Tax=Acetilactobacillus jinshanensis TaxID=1720083 RepID=A0A4P6ZLE3_9LACO|nr:MDR family MFS transporter [Acetilactobacillus jinshanensis]QBP18564.1 DHA2 family efflux MFS transporter permease subunit [Acetilactobacillus jinshanensis]URL61438.1 multidrug efflux MFS transporter [uncultured bacterium]
MSKDINGETYSQKILMEIVLSGAFVALLAETFLNNGLTTIMKSLQVSQATAQWLSTAYQLVMGLMIPLSAWVFNNFKTKDSYKGMLAIFTFGSFVCFIAPNFAILLVGRIIEAIAAGALMPFIQNIVLALFPPEKRGLGLGITGLVIAFAPATGPSIAGLLLKFFNWRILFLVLSVLSGIVFLISFSYSRTLNKVHRSKLDFLSLLWSTIGFGGLLYAFSAIGNSGRIDLVETITFIVGIIFIALFCIRQNHLTKPVVSMKVFKNGIFNLSTILSTLSNFAMLGIELIIPLYLQNVRGLSALDTGLILIPGAVLTGIFNPVAGVIFDKIGARKVSVIGFVLLTLGTVPMLTFGTETNIIWIMSLYALRLVGITFITMNDFTAGINALNPRLKAHGNAASSTVRQIGSSLGTALSITMVTLGMNFNHNLGKMSSLVVGYHWAFMMMTIVAIIGLVLSFWLPKKVQKATK